MHKRMKNLWVHLVLHLCWDASSPAVLDKLHDMHGMQLHVTAAKSGWPRCTALHRIPKCPLCQCAGSCSSCTSPSLDILDRKSCQLQMTRPLQATRQLQMTRLTQATHQLRACCKAYPVTVALLHNYLVTQMQPKRLTGWHNSSHSSRGLHVSSHVQLYSPAGFSVHRLEGRSTTMKSGLQHKQPSAF